MVSLWNFRQISNTEKKTHYSHSMGISWSTYELFGRSFRILKNKLHWSYSMGISWSPYELFNRPLRQLENKPHWLHSMWVSWLATNFSANPHVCWKKNLIGCSSDGDTDFFDSVAGVLQGDTLAPYLLIICLDYVVRTSIDKMKENGFKLIKERSRRYSPPIT